MPKIKIYTSVKEQKFTEIFQYPGETLLKAMKRNGIRRSYPCGGDGLCGKCRFRILKGNSLVSLEEKKFLTQEELDSGMRLLCRASFLADAEVCLEDEKEGKITTPDADKMKITGEALFRDLSDDAAYDAAIDIGTTTLAFALVDRKIKKTAAVVTRNNSQRAFGADVMSRIKAANEGEGGKLKRLIWQDIIDGLDELLKSVKGGSIGRIVIAANTTMCHLLMGDSCEGLGTAPFQPVSLELRTKLAKEIWEEMPKRYAQVRVLFLPGASAFIGADIVAGIYSCSIHQARKNVLFVDLGTNGEMVLNVKGKMYATSAAAGPAFEGGNISRGVPGVPGAINSVSSMGGRLIVHTIGNKRPVGLCGTGILDVTYEMFKMGVSDETGAFHSSYQTTGFIVTDATADGKPICFTQEDMRQVQMAKSAIRAGIELLKEKCSIVSADIEKVYVAGGFGCKLNIHKAVGIGLLPRELQEKTEAVGNTSLLGAIRCLVSGEDTNVIKKIATDIEVMNLAENLSFEEKYYAYMNFNC